MNRQLYSKRLTDHIAHAKTLYKDGDFVQAGEKIWGALSALINSRSTWEVKSAVDKRTNFLRLFNAYQVRDPTLRSKMQNLGFRRDDEIWLSVFGLHKFFYGGAFYTDEKLSKIIPFFIELIENL